MIALAKTAALLAGCYLLLLAAVFVWQRRLIYLPLKELTHTPADAGLAYLDVRLVVDDRIAHGWWVPHDEPRGTLLFCHGNAGNMGHRLQSLTLFHRMGLNVLIFDYAGYGASPGRPTQENLCRDVRAAWDWLVRDQGVAPGTIVLFGRSLGGGVAAQLVHDLAPAGVVPAGLVLESTFTSMAELVARQYPWLPARVLIRDRYDSAAALRECVAPLLSIHSRDDEIVPFALGERLYREYPGPKRQLVLQGDHNNAFLLSREAYESGWRGFLADVLPESGRKDFPGRNATAWNYGKYIQ